MDWEPYIASALRLVDLADCARTPGGTPQAPADTRSGDSEGFWLDLGVRLLEYVERNWEDSDWIALAPFVDEQQERDPEITLADAQTILYYLSTPCLVHWRHDDARAYAIKDETMLLERPLFRAPDRCRLTKRGRLALRLARAGDDWLYLHHDARKIVTALHAGDVRDAATQATEVRARVREFARELTRMMEDPARDALHTHFLEREAVYTECIREVSNAATQARQLASGGDTPDGQSVSDDDDAVAGEWTATSLLERFHALVQGTEVLHRTFTRFIDRVHNAGEAPEVPGWRFDKTALYLAFHAPPPAPLQALVHALEPGLVEAACIAPEDVMGVGVSMRGGESEGPSAVLAPEPVRERPALMDRFLVYYAETLRTALRSGPVSLGWAVAEGWFDVDGEAALAQLVGVFAAPQWLAGEGMRLRVAPAADSLLVEANDRALHGDDLTMALMPIEAVGDDEFQTEEVNDGMGYRALG